MTSRRLWLDPTDQSPQKEKVDDIVDDNFDTIFDRFSSRPPKPPLGLLIWNSLVVGQEFVLTCLLLAGHRAGLVEEMNIENESEDSDFFSGLLPSLILTWLSFLIVVLHNKSSYSTQSKLRHRLSDGLFMVVLLRFLSAVLKTLTASYSSDTVHALAIASLFLHLLACDYTYANGWSDQHNNEILDSKKRPKFQGGTVSLTAAFFATILLASRLQSNTSVYTFICASMTIFALYPAARHQVAVNTQSKNTWGKLPCSTSVDIQTAFLILFTDEPF